MSESVMKVSWSVLPLRGATSDMIKDPRQTCILRHFSNKLIIVPVV